jgi:hypothetical protein
VSHPCFPKLEVVKETFPSQLLGRPVEVRRMNEGVECNGFGREKGWWWFSYSLCIIRK